MRLTDLKPQFLRYELRDETWVECIANPAKVGGSALDEDYYLHDDDGSRLTRTVTGKRAYWKHVGTIGEAQGVSFVCPKCCGANGGNPDGVHAIVCWSRSAGVPEDATPGPGRWRLSGTGYGDLSLLADPPSAQSSVKLEAGCCWHGHVINGETTDT